MSIKRIFVGCAALLMTSMTVSAATSPSAQQIIKTDQFVNMHAMDFIDGKLTPEQFVQLKLMAHQAAVAAVCEGFKLSEDKFVSAFGELAHERGGEMTDAEKQYYERHLLVSYGTLLGGEVARAAPDPSGFCEAAREERKDPDLAEHNLWE
jgi:hypothetical protein